MSKFITVTSIASRFLLTCLTLTLAGPTQAEYYIAADAAYMDTKVGFKNGTTNVELTPIRVKFGRRFHEFGWEFHLISPADDTGVFTGFGNSDEYKINYGLGLMLTASSVDRHFYGGIGFTAIDSEYTVLAVPISTEGIKAFTTINLGTQWELAKNNRITFDYTFYHGNIDCNFCSSPTPPPGFTVSNPDVRISSFAIGYSHTFD